MTTNEAAERLSENLAATRMRNLIGRWVSPAVEKAFRADLDEALAAERRATVERIRERLLENRGHRLTLADIRRILDEEAAR